MPAKPPAPSGAPCWIDLLSSDPTRAAEFYGAIFGWTAGEPAPEFGGYVNFTKDGVVIAGLMRNTTDESDVWTTYLSVPDAEVATKAARAAGGHVYLDAVHRVGPLGSMGMVADPGGATIGLWQPGLHEGYGLDGEPGTPYWHELHTRDYTAVLDFYRTVFGWQTRAMSDDDRFRYTQLVLDGHEYAGVMDGSGFLPEGMPSAWQVYIGVADVDATLTRVVGLGGTVLAPAESTPFGRLAQIADPMGASIKLAQGVPG